MKKVYLATVVLGVAAVLSGCVSLKSSSSLRDGGIFKSVDFGEHWTQKVQLIGGTKALSNLANVDTHFLVFDPKNEGTLYFVSQGAGVFRTTDGGDKWQQTLAAGTYSSLSIDAHNTNVVYVASDKQIVKSVDGMKSWQTIYLETRPGQKLISVIVDPFEYGIVYAATTTGLIKSFDYGNTWKLLNWQQPQISALYQSNRNTAVLYALTNQGIFKSTNGANDWSNTTTALKQYKGALTIYWVDFDPDRDIMFLGTAYGIFKSTDGGNRWETVTTLFDFKKVPIKAVIHNPDNLNEIIFSVGTILHKTDDGGRTWKTLKSVPTSRLINYLIADPYHKDTVFLGTTKPPKK